MIPFSNSTVGPAPNTGDVPTWDGNKWKSQAPSSGGGTVVKTFLASQANAIAALQGGGFLPATGTVAVTVEGFGGGGGGGGSGGTAGAPGAGGGGARYNHATVLIDLTHQIDVVIGAGGVGGTAGTTTASGAPGNDGGASYANDVTANNVLVAFGGASGGHGSGNAAGGVTQPGGDHPALIQPDTNAVDACAITTTTLNPKPVGITGAGGSGLSSSQGFRSQPNSVQLDSTVANPILVGAPGGTFVVGASGGGGGNGPRGVGATGAPGQNVANSNGNPGGNAAANTGAGGGGGSPGAAGAGTPTGGPGGNGGTGWLRMTFHLSTTVAP